jgi:hypothetical protein
VGSIVKNLNIRFFCFSMAGNYGWKVLMHFSFVSGKYPAEISTGISLSQYARVFVANGIALIPELSIGLLLAVAAWSFRLKMRNFLLPVFAACFFHYALFPSGEARYFAWAYLVAAMLFIRAVRGATGLSILRRSQTTDSKTAPIRSLEPEAEALQYVECG